MSISRKGPDCRKLHFIRNVKCVKLWFTALFTYNSQRCLDYIREAGTYT